MRIGESVLRADGPAKVRGDFIYSSDLHVDRMLWGATVRSPHPYARAGVVIRGEYEIGMQGQARLGPESGLAIPDGDGGGGVHSATQWVHVDQDQLTGILGLPQEKVRLTMAGIGGAFVAREDL